MNSSEMNHEGNQKSLPNVDFIPYDLLEESSKLSRGVWGRECIFKPTKKTRTLFMLPSKPEKWFTNELASASRLKHYNIIEIHGRTCVGGVNGILTECVEGRSLKKVIHDKSISYTLGDVLRWNTQSFRALEYVIQSFPGKENENFRRYFNRIVCPENMILNPTRDVLKICSLGLFEEVPDPKDFDLLKYLDFWRFSDKKIRWNVPPKDYPYYWAPEVWNGEYRYEESDVYSFGVVLWECITRFKLVAFPGEKLTFSDSVDYFGTTSMFDEFIERTVSKSSEDRLPVSVIRRILENMVLAETGENLEVFKNADVICIWNEEEFYYCKKLVSFRNYSKIWERKSEQADTIFEYDFLKNLKELASGKFGKVCSAEYKSKQIAIKFLKTLKIEPFLKEFNILNQLEHENIVKVIGQTEKNGIYGIVMEYIDGTSLDKIIHKAPKEYTLRDVFTWNLHAASALEYMHFHRFLHRDVKPDNMLIENSENRALKIVDLGGAKQIHNSLNSTGMGTESYIAPEIDNKDHYDEQCDVYSWTITFWECLTAQKPQRPPDYRSKICSAKFVKVLKKCSSTNPADRKPMYVIKKWLEDMLNNRKAFTETNLTFRQNHISIWNEQDNELFYFPKTRTLYEERFKKDLKNAKKFSRNIAMAKLRIIRNMTSKNQHIKFIDKGLDGKMLKFSKAAEEKFMENEFIVLSKLKHENIIKLFGYTHDKELNYFGIILEFPGSNICLDSLEKVIARGEYETKQIVEWSLQVARGLEYMHSRNILHCDIQPVNIMVIGDQCKISGFSSSRDLEYSHPKKAVGTGIYMAPEVRRDGLLTTKSDVYSWTVTFWELCKRQYVSETDFSKVAFIKQMKSIDLCDAREAYRIENASDEFNDFIQTCANADPDKRWSMTHIVTLLENMLENHSKSSYRSDFDNIQTDMVVNNNICLWNKIRTTYSREEQITHMKANKNSPEMYSYNLYNYKLLKNLKILGSGCFGKVCSAEYEGKKVAVKFQMAMKMYPFLQEFNVLSQLRHENIVRVFGKIETDGIYGIVMEYIDGTSLAKIIHEVPLKYTLGDVLKWNYQAASALDYMHSQRCLYRDVKPDNMMIEDCEKRSLKIVDFGSAKITQSSLSFTAMGTELYMAPEIDNHDPYNEKCDVYSWAITFWECLTAERPQSFPDYRSKINQVCSAKFVEIIERCSSYNPSDRKPMFIIKKWLGDMLNNRKAFTDTDPTFRENHICVWNEQTNELYYFQHPLFLEFEKRFKKRTKDKTSIVNVPMDAFRIIRDLKYGNGNLKLIEAADPRLLPCPSHESGCRYENKTLCHSESCLQTIENEKVLKFFKDDYVEYLPNEFLILSKLKHENIVKLYGYIHDSELRYFGTITEFFKSKTLVEVIADGYCPTECILKWSLNSVKGLEYMHSQNILHCNIKPDNILVTYYTDKFCKICDFHLSRDLQYEHPKEAVGTGIYMAPEVRKDGLLTTMSDVYSWAVTFWELCKFGPAIKSLSNMKIEDIRQMDSIDLWEERERSRVERGSDKFNDFIYACSNKDPEKRWSFSDIGTLLENMLKNHSNSNYVPDYDNIEDEILVKNNICLWGLIDKWIYNKKDFFYASADLSLDLPIRTGSNSYTYEECRVH